MPLSVPCPKCSAAFPAAESPAPYAVNCPRCGTAVLVPATPPPPRAARPAPNPFGFDDEEEDDRPRRPRRREEPRRSVLGSAFAGAFGIGAGLLAAWVLLVCAVMILGAIFLR